MCWMDADCVGFGRKAVILASILPHDMILRPKKYGFSLVALAAFFCFWLNAPAASAQQPDSTILVLPDSAALAQADSALPGAQKRRGPLRFIREHSPDPIPFFKKDYPNPRKAVLLAAVIPGTGQLYNKKWWKLPIVYGAIGGMAWWTYDNASTFSEYSINYKAQVDDDPNTKVTDPKFETVDVETLRTYRDRFRKYTEQSYLGLGLVYLLSITDAYVDAQLYNFDVSEDLSFRLVPSLQSSPGFGAAFGIGLQIPLYSSH